MVFFDFDFEFVPNSAGFKDIRLGGLETGSGRLGYNILSICDEP